MTVIDFEVFERISAKEWNQRPGGEGSALKESMDLTRFIEHWVQSEILEPEFPADRVSVLIKFVQLSQELKISSLLQHAQGSDQWDVIPLHPSTHLHPGIVSVSTQEQVH